MDDEQETGVVPAVVDAHIKNLLSALGGFSPENASRYVPGDSAIDCLRDLKRWLRLFDDKLNRLDVARCISGTTLMRTDIPHIVRNWTAAPSSTLKHKLALAALELAVILTWPLDRDAESTTLNHYMHMPALQRAHMDYKDRLLDARMGLLQAAVRMQLPAMAKSARDRSPKDDALVKMALYLVRNTALIQPPPDTDAAEAAHKASLQRSMLVRQCASQRVFPFVLTLASNIEDFATADVLLLEILFHTVKRVDTAALFAPDAHRAQLGSAMEALIANEKASLQRNLPSRHSRFGTMVWMTRADGKVTTLAGQDALGSAEARQLKLDAGKTFRPVAAAMARRRHMETRDMGPEPALDPAALEALRSFVEDFLDGGFNPLVGQLRRSVEREAPHVMGFHQRQFFYVVAWFLSAELERRRQAQKKQKKSQPEGENQSENDNISSFNLVAAALSQEMFISLQRHMRVAFENKAWDELVAAMRCFNQILLVVRAIYESQADADVEIADNILSRLFYEEDTQELLAAVLRAYNGQGLEFLDTTVELVHNYTHLLSAYSAQNADMQVRAKRARRRNKAATSAAAAAATTTDDQDPPLPPPELSGSDSDDAAAAATKTSQDRRFDFQKFLQRFSAQPVVDAYVAYTHFYRDLSNEQLKRAHRFFFRLGFKQDKLVMLFRVDVLNLLYEMVRGRSPINPTFPVARDWAELGKHVFRRVVQKLGAQPEMFVELLFSKSSAMAYFIDHGYEKKKAPAKLRVAAELVFRNITDLEEQLRLLVQVLYGQGKHAEVKWVADSIGEGISAAAAAASTDSSTDPTTPHILTADPQTQAQTLKNGNLRLLLATVGITRPPSTTEELLETPWHIAPTTPLAHLERCASLLATIRLEDVSDDAAAAAQRYIRRKPMSRAMIDSDTDSDSGALFPAGGPTARRAVDGARTKKKARRRRRGDGSGDDDQAVLSDDDEAAAERARRRREKEREKARKIKSDMFVHSSDDDSDNAANDEAFWRQEAEQRRVNEEAFLRSHMHGSGKTGEPKAATAAESARKRKLGVQEDSADEMEVDDGLPTFDDGDDDDNDDDDVEMGDETRQDEGKKVEEEEAEQDEDEDEEVIASARKRRTTGGFILDSDSDE